MVKAGQVYRHYKGHIYIVCGIARHSETLEELVVYYRQGNLDDMWVRPLAMFSERLPDGRARFELVIE